MRNSSDNLAIIIQSQDCLRGFNRGFVCIYHTPAQICQMLLCTYFKHGRSGTVFGRSFSQSVEGVRV